GPLPVLVSWNRRVCCTEPASTLTSVEFCQVTVTFTSWSTVNTAVAVWISVVAPRVYWAEAVLVMMVPAATSAARTAGATATAAASKTAIRAATPRERRVCKFMVPIQTSDNVSTIVVRMTIICQQFCNLYFTYGLI